MPFKGMTLLEISALLAEREELSVDEAWFLKNDSRRGAARLLERFQKKAEAHEAEEMRLRKMFFQEEQLRHQGYKLIAGIDEAGRGPLAGPVFAAAVILEPESLIEGLNDSKQLSACMREKLFEKIIVDAKAYAIGSASREEIDEMNIHAASMLAMLRAVNALACKPDYLIVDGFPIRRCPYRQKALKSGDRLSLSIAAASIMAKVARDRVMLDLHRQYPVYGFDRNMGYGTEEHRFALKRYGPCPAHRRSFRLT
ncbi:MAG: ribonuclease HII [Bacillota bacterium]|nr:ribonuclease HII [Bacillota bacterium]